MSEIRTVDFNALPKSVRERFVAITTGAAGPAPALTQKTSTKSKVVGLIFLFVLLALVALFVVAVGFGDYGNELGVHGPIGVIFAYIPVFFLVFLVLLTIVMRFVLKSPFPYQPGKYLFATDFVDAHDGKLRIIPTQLLTDFNGTHMHQNGRYTHTLLTFTFGQTREVFTIWGQEAAQAGTDAFWNGRQALAAASQAQDWHTVANLDPFFECRRTGIWEQGGAPGVTGGPVVKTVPVFFRLRAVVALVLALFLAPVIALARNVASDEVMYNGAKDADAEYAYGSYIDHGWRHVDEAKLAQPIAAFNAAKKSGKVSDVRHVLETYPNSSVDADARSYMHTLYAQALDTFRAQASKSDPRVIPFVEHMVAYMEKNDTSVVRVVFSPPTVGALQSADTLFQKKFGTGGKIVEPISPFFNEQHSSIRQSSIVSKLNEAFSAIFPADILTIKESDSTPNSKDPTIAIAYTVGPSGSAYTSDEGQRVFVGIDVDFDMHMAIPDGSGPFDFALTVSPPQRFEYSYMEGASQAEAAYEAMAQRAFDEFTTKMKAIFFKTDPSADKSSSDDSTSDDDDTGTGSL